MAAGRERIFLYGTLRRGGTRDVLKFYEGAEFVATARVRGVLYDFIEYPGLRLLAEGGWVTGELFDVTPAALALLDEWEGIDPEAADAGEFRRIFMTAKRGENAFEACWTYELKSRKAAGAPVIESGDWIAYNALRG